MHGEVESFYVGKSGKYVVLNVAIPDDDAYPGGYFKGQVYLSREQLEYMFNAEPLYVTPLIPQVITPADS